jgi:hypothetical protein
LYGKPKIEKQMKKISILFLTVLILGTFFTSCSNEVSGSVDMSLIKGKWKFNKSTATSNGFTIPYTTEYFKNEEGCDKDYIDLIAGEVVEYGNYKTDCVKEEKEGTWEQSDNTIIISVTDTSFNGTFDVVSLSATELILKIDGTFEGKSGTLHLYFTK